MNQIRWLVLAISILMVGKVCAANLTSSDFKFLSDVRTAWITAGSILYAWNGGADKACTWPGVTCSDDKLNTLNMTNLAPTNTWQLPSSFNATNLRRLILPNTKLAGTIPKLPLSLRLLDLANNRLTGSIPVIPTTGCELTEIRVSSNLLEGRIPDLYYCPNLKVFSLASNSFSGAVPELHRFPSLRVFDASFNMDLYWDSRTVLSANMTSLSLQAVPNRRGTLFSTMPDTIKFLNLRYSNLSGTIPSTLFSTQSDLQHLELGSNALEGTLPSTLGSPSSIRAVYLDWNRLMGRIPRFKSRITHLVLNANFLDDFNGNAQWSSLVTLNARGNRLAGTIPAGVLQSPDLVTLDLSMNQLEGTLPIISSSLERVDVSFNRLTAIPGAVFAASGLQTLCLQNNSFSGQLPSTLGSNLEELNAENNYLSGTIPEWTSTKLKALSLANNNLEGSIPSSISGMTSLTSLKLEQNSLTGLLPSSFPSGLTTLWLHENRLQGDASASFSNLNGLTSLKVSNNAFHGVIDPMMALPNLEILNLDGNRFEGTIPSPSSHSLVVFTAQNNGLYGDIPQSFSGEIAWLELQNNELTGTLSSALINSFGNMVYLNLGHNHLSGSVPSLLAAFKLYYLNLEHNQFEGSIPQLATGVSSGLTYLNIGHNRFTGSISPSMSSLLSLQHLNLEHNQLDGFFFLYLLDLPLRTLQIGNNKLVGSLPPRAVRSPLVHLDMHSNRIGMAIPEWVGTSGMTYIDLSDNRFTLGIPRFNYSGAYLNVSSNRLSLCDPEPNFAVAFELGQCDLTSQTVCAHSDTCKNYYEGRGCRTTILSGATCPQPCFGVKPGAGFFCEHGSWVSTGVNTTGTIIVTGATKVEGNFTMTGEVVFHGTTTLSVGGCTDFSGSLVIELSEEELEEYMKNPGDRVVMTSAQGWCEGHEGLLSVQVKLPKTCRTVHSSPSRVGNTILVHFTVSTKGCTTNGWWKAIVGVLAAVVVVVIAAALIFTFNRNARLLVRPYAKFDERGAQELVLTTENQNFNLSEPLLEGAAEEGESEWARNSGQRHLSDMERWRRG